MDLSVSVPDAGWTMPSLESEFPPDQNWIYKQTPQGDLRLFGFFPPERKTASGDPAIVFFFGGGWRGGTPAQFFPFCRYLADHGMAAFSAEYRVLTRHNTAPDACVEDSKFCLTWMRGHAGELGIDTGKLAAGGGSAGGHVAACTATARGFLESGRNAADYRGPEACVLFNPVLKAGPDTRWFERMEPFYPDISPIDGVRPGLPPTLVLHGTGDTTVPVDHTIEFAQRMAEAGNRCEVELYEGAGHGFFNYKEGDNPYFLRTRDRMHAFLFELGFAGKERR